MCGTELTKHMEYSKVIIRTLSVKEQENPRSALDQRVLRGFSAFQDVLLISYALSSFRIFFLLPSERYWAASLSSPFAFRRPLRISFRPPLSSEPRTYPSFCFVAYIVLSATAMSPHDAFMPIPSSSAFLFLRT